MVNGNYNPPAPKPEKGFDKGTVVRTILYALVWLNVLLEQNGLQAVPVLNEEAIALALTFAVSTWSWFKNNYLTLKGKRQKAVLKRNGLAK